MNLKKMKRNRKFDRDDLGVMLSVAINALKRKVKKEKKAQKTS